MSLLNLLYMISLLYFGTITTICEDILNMADRKGHEVYDRHFWNDDTLECKIVTTQEIESKCIETQYTTPKRIEKLKKQDNELANKIDEIIDVLNKYEYMIETDKLKGEE